ncbi:MAG: acyltransferase family protein [Clostridiales bacterium]|nr:acyltransferase family protein [Clostridiales bacterium]
MGQTGLRRIGWIDTSKAFAIFLIVLGHALRDGAIHTYAFSFHVPLFLMLAGLVFCPEKYERLRDFLKEKAKTILLPYLIFALISVGIFLIFGGQVGEELSVDADKSWWECLAGIFYGNHRTFTMKANLPLWYLPCLFFTELIYYVLCRVKTQRRLAIVSGAAVAMLLTGVNYYFCHIVGLPFDPETVLALSPFFAVGMLLRDLPSFLYPQGKPWRDICLGVLLVIAGAVIGMLNGYVAYTQYIYGVLLLFYDGALLSCLGWMTLLRRLPVWSPAVFLGQSTLAVLVMHKFPIVLFQAKVPVIKDLLRENEALVGVAVSVIAILLCLAAQWVIVRVAPFALGRSRKKKASWTEG